MVYTDLAVSGPRRGHGQRDKLIRLILTLSLPLTRKKEGLGLAITYSIQVSACPLDGTPTAASVYGEQC